ncbi:hypothetical protein BDP27DRAFT_389493 [Rhodocollybia butyracea]|uniref:F-box domain-containing protein n=1 Tax=Rhodocollybia butyracea TaxID=206335 RepID=A0A9P5UB75_9AGAR|nr:hypothetical protein BDP27DRAFT_389493 [Rhodocollybia butyracea]
MNGKERPKRSKARKNYNEEQSDDDHDAPVDNYEPKPTSEIEKDTLKLEVRPSKKRKPAISSKKDGPTKFRGRKAGSLERMLTLPPEMQNEILGHVAPEILVMCLQVSHLRELLILTSSESTWKKSRISAGMPALHATDMTERKYLILLFDKHCHDCGDPKVDHSELDLLACARL